MRKALPNVRTMLTVPVVLMSLKVLMVSEVLRMLKAVEVSRIRGS